MEIKLNKDLNTYKTKDIFIFSFKEVGFAIAGIALFLVVNNLTKPYFPSESETPMLLAIVAMLPPLVLGFAKPKGYSFMEYLKEIWLPSITQIKEKKWVSDFDESSFEDLIVEESVEKITPEEQGDEENEEVSN